MVQLHLCSLPPSNLPPARPLNTASLRIPPLPLAQRVALPDLVRTLTLHHILLRLYLNTLIVQGINHLSPSLLWRGTSTLLQKGCIILEEMYDVLAHLGLSSSTVQYCNPSISPCNSPTQDLKSIKVGPKPCTWHMEYSNTMCFEVHLFLTILYSQDSEFHNSSLLILKIASPSIPPHSLPLTRSCCSSNFDA